MQILVAIKYIFKYYIRIGSYYIIDFILYIIYYIIFDHHMNELGDDGGF